MSFPAGWTEGPFVGQYSRTVDPTVAALAYTIMTLPADTKIAYAHVDDFGPEHWEPVTQATYVPDKGLVILG